MPLPSVPRRPQDPEARSLWRTSKVYWWCLAGILAWTLAATLLLPPPNGDGPVPRPVLRATPFYLVLSLAAVNLAVRSVVALRRARRGAPQWTGWLFTLIDLALVAAGLRFCGGLQSPLWIVLFVVVVAETILSPQKEARLVRWCVGVALVAGTWSLDLPQPVYWLETGMRLFFLIVVSMITRRLRERQDEKNAELATLRSELALAGERTRLSREIHDGVGNALAAAVLRLEVAARMGEKRPETVPATLREEAQALREAMNAVRDWTFFTRPWPTVPASASPTSSGGETFGRILEREAARLGQRTGLPVAVEGADALDGLPEPARIAALRITQEALTNAAKYANAQHATVSVRRDGNGVCLTIRDDGQGFDPAGALDRSDSDGHNAHRPGIGLTGMRERAESLGGTLEVIAAPGAGVTVCARLPLS